MKAELDHCPSAALLELLLSEQLTGPDLDSVETHVESCGSCQERLDQIIGKTHITMDHSRANHAYETQPDEDFLCRLKHLPLPHVRVSERTISADQQPLSDDSAAKDVIDRFERRRLGQYEILGTLGKGNMGVVYKALHTELDKIVALKVLPASSTDEVDIARFKNEARAAGRLDHSNIVTAHDAGQAEGVHFLVMTFVDGIDLARLVQRQGSLSVPDACELIRQAAVGLQHAFERGLVHRDIKPSNLMLARTGVVKVLDLGIARLGVDTLATERLTATGMLLGTADYLAPEQWDNPHAVDTRADIYSLGCSLYHLIAGHPPFSSPRYPSVMSKMRAHIEAPVPPIRDERPEVPDQLAAVLDRMLAKNPTSRFTTPGEVAAALQPFTSGANLLTLLEPRTKDGVLPTSNPGMELVADTDRSARTFTADQSNNRSFVRPTKRIARRFRVAISLAGLCIAAVIAHALWFTQHGPHPPGGPAKIESMTVNQYRGESATLLGDISTTSQEILTTDSVRVATKLKAPGYCYLLAFNPDGAEQLCYPEDPELPAVLYTENKNAKSMELTPSKNAEFQFPKDEYFEPGQKGLQVFVLIASAEPLRPYAKWRSQVGSIPWKKTDSYDQPNRWEFDGQDYHRLPEERGQKVERGGAPKAFRDLCDFLRKLRDVQAVRALAFPVTKK
jgi:serine/threonine protein kinase